MFMKPDVETVSRLNLFDIFEKENINTIYYETHNFISKTTDKLKKDSSLPRITRDKIEELGRKLNGENKTQEFNKLESINFESLNEKKLKKLEEYLQQLVKEKKKIVVKLNDLTNNINGINLDLEVLDNYEKYYDLTDRFKKIVDAENLNSPHERKQKTKKKETNKQFDDILFEYRYNITSLMYNRRNENDNKKIQLEMKIKERIELIKYLENLTNEIQKTRKEIDIIKTSLGVHYHQLLKYGKDVRHEGLSWLVRAIWRLGYDVMYSCLPSFLDEDLIYYLFTYSKKEMELSKKVHQIKEYYAKFSNKNKTKSMEHPIKRTSSISYEKQSINVSDVDKAIKDKYKKSNYNLKVVMLNKQNTFNNNLFLNKILEKNSEEIFEKLSLNQIKNYIELEERVRIDNRVVNHLNTIKQIEAECDSLKKELIQLRNNELSRINKEFLLNDYERRFGVTQDVIVSAISGEDQAANIFSSQIKEQRVYHKNLEICRTFNIIQPKMINKMGNLKKITIKDVDIFVNN